MFTTVKSIMAAIGYKHEKHILQREVRWYTMEKEFMSWIQGYYWMLLISSLLLLKQMNQWSLALASENKNHLPSQIQRDFIPDANLLQHYLICLPLIILSSWPCKYSNPWINHWVCPGARESPSAQLRHWLVRQNVSSGPWQTLVKST